MATIETDTIQKLAEGLAATPRIQEGAALAGTGLVLPMARVRTRAAMRERVRIVGREGEKSDAAIRATSLVAALATREHEIAASYARRAGPRVETGEGEASIDGLVTRDRTPLIDAEVAILDTNGRELRRTCTGRDGRYAIAIPADADVRIEVRQDGKPQYRDKTAQAYPAAYRSRRDIEIGDADPVCDPVDPDGGGTVQMPELVGLGREQAFRTIKALGLTLGDVKETPSKQAGIVLAQKPDAGSAVAPESAVSLEIGRDDDRPATRVEDLKGRTLNDALGAIREAKIDIASVRIVPGDARTATVHETMVTDNGEAIHLEVAVRGDKAAETDVVAEMLAASPEAAGIRIDSATAARRWLATASVASLDDLEAAAAEDDAALRKRLGLGKRTSVEASRQALVATARRIVRR